MRFEFIIIIDRCSVSQSITIVTYPVMEPGDIPDASDDGGRVRLEDGLNAVITVWLQFYVIRLHLINAASVGFRKGKL